MSGHYHGSVDNATRAVSNSGSHFFDRDTMRFFGSRTYELYEGHNGSFLVMSDRDSHGAYGARRYYYVVQIVPVDDGQSWPVANVERLNLEPPLVVDETSGVHGYWTLEAARRLARRLSRG